MSDWQTISIKPLTGALNTRARPSDLAPGEWRWKQNLRVNDTGHLSRRDGFGRFALLSASGINHDHHQRGRTRLPITMLFESNASDGTRRLFDATNKEVSVLEPNASTWTELASGMGGANGSRFRAAELQDVVIFTNNVDTVRSHTLGSTEFDAIADLATLNVTKAYIVVQYAGFILLMNIEQDSKRESSRVMWSDINRPLKYVPGEIIEEVESLAGFQDLDYGDDILAAAQLGGDLLIYTRNSIWRCYVAAASSDLTFGFQKIYSEPENKKGCIVYPNTLVNLGDAHLFCSRDDFYVFNRYVTAPKNLAEWEWLHKGTGQIFDKLQWPKYALDPSYCEAPIAKYVPKHNEVWISWPSRDAAGINNHTLVANIVYSTCDYVDHGFTAFVNDRQTAEATKCDETQTFIGASFEDYALKAIGEGVFKRELISVVDPAQDIETPVYFDEGYNTRLVGPLTLLGFPHLDKIIDNLLLEHDTVAQDVPCLINLRVGNSYNLADPLNADGKCAVQFKTYKTRNLECPGTKKVSELAAKNLRPSFGLEWQPYCQGRYLYIDILVFGATGPAIGGDSAWSKIDVHAMVLHQS